MRNGSIGRALATLCLALLLGGASGCGDETIVGPRNPDDVTFDSSLNVDLDSMTELEEGLYMKVLEEGEGALTAAAGTSVRAEYTVWLSDGTQVLGPVQRTLEAAGEPIPLAGLSRGIVGAKEGEVRQLVIGSELAWGALGAEGIPPHSVVVMVVEVIEVTID